MRGKQGEEPLTSGVTAAELVKDRQTIAKLARSKEAQSLMELLRQSGDVQHAAQNAARGDPTALVSMLEKLVKTQQGAQLIGEIGDRARQAGLEKTP